MQVRTLRSVRTLLVVPAMLSLVVASAWAQMNSRPLRPAEQAFLDRIAAEFAKILPPVPAGWAEVERRIYDAGGMTSDWDGPLNPTYQVQLVRTDLEARQEVVRKRGQEMTDKNRDAFEAATARTQKMMEEYGAKMQAALEKNDQAAQKRLTDEYEKNMAAASKASAMPDVPRPELSDTYAHIDISINPYNESVAAEKKILAPAGFLFAERSEPDKNSSDREGVTRYVLGAWSVNTVGGGYDLKFTPNKGAVVYGIEVRIEARADRADALFKAMNIARLKALLVP